MRWIVTGSAGFLGQAVVAKLLENSGQTVMEWRRQRATGARGAAGDLASLGIDALARRIIALLPDVIIHCAGRTPPAATTDYWRQNTAATAALLAACARVSQKLRVVVVGSAAELGPVSAEHLPVFETCPCRPADAYGLSKWAATRLAIDAARAERCHVVVGRIFNLIGPSMPVNQVFGRFARELGAAESDPVTIRASDLGARRDFVDVRDAAAALIELAQRGRSGEVYHIASGVAHSIGDGFGELVRLSGRSVHAAPSARPPSGALESRASITKIVTETEWRPAIPFERSMLDLWESCRAPAADSVHSRSVA